MFKFAMPSSEALCSIIKQGEVAASSSADSLSQQYITSASISVDTHFGTASSQAYGKAQLYATASEAPLPANLANAARGFPLIPTLPAASPPLPNPNAPITLSLLVKYYLPPSVEGMRLIRLYLDQAPWFFGAVTEKQIEEEIIPMWYQDELNAGSIPGSTTLPGVSAGKQKQREGTSHDLALLFMVFCFGALTDTNLAAPPDNPIADRFYQLVKVALILDPNALPGGID